MAEYVTLYPLGPWRAAWGVVGRYAAVAAAAVTGGLLLVAGVVANSAILYDAVRLR